MQNFMKHNSNKKTGIFFGLLCLLSGCAMSYSRPVSLSTASERIRQTLKTWEETDFSSFSSLTLTSTFCVRNASHHSLQETTVTKMQYEANPYVLALEETATQKGEDKNLYSYVATISHENGTYMVQEGEKRIEASSWEGYSFYSPYFDLPSFFRLHGTALLNKADSLLSQIGTITNPQSNELTGFRALSKGGDELEVTFDGSDFGIQDHFFQPQYEDKDATSFSLKISGGRLRSYQVTFVYVEPLVISSSSGPEFDVFHQTKSSGTKEMSVENVWDYGA